MKINRPININKPILIRSKEEYNKIAIQLHKMGYKWIYSNLLDFKPQPNEFYLMCDKKRMKVNWSEYYYPGYIVWFGIGLYKFYSYIYIIEI